MRHDGSYVIPAGKVCVIDALGRDITRAASITSDNDQSVIDLKGVIAGQYFIVLEGKAIYPAIRP